MSELEASGAGEPPPPYMIFVVVFLFFVTGLLGFLVCHLLKKKGYRCRAGDMDDEEEEEEEKLGAQDDEYEENQDTVEQILKCIIENEANMEAFNEMLGNRNLCVRHDPRLRKESIAGIPPHHHTVHSGMDHNTCHLCAQGRTKKGRRPSRTPRFRQRPGEQTVFAVGRFRVTHTDKKAQGGPNPLASSGDQLDQSQDSEERKDGGYNLRSMFKDVRPPSENVNGVAPSVGKRRKSLTLFGLRRGSDPVGVKVVEGTGRETGGLKFTVQRQPVVLEEPLQTQNVEAHVDPRQAPAAKPKSETKQGATIQHEAKTPDSVHSPSSQGGKQDRDSNSGPQDKRGPSPSNIVTTVNTVSGTVPAPSSLPVLSGKTIDVGGKVLKTDGAYDPGPLQTSTPLAPMPESTPGTTLFLPATQPESYSSAAFPVTQTPPDPSSSPHQESGANLVLISLGSSPPSSFPSKTLSSVSSLKSPTSPLVETPSPKLGSRNVSSEASTAALSPALTPSLKLPPSQQASRQSLLSPSSFGQTEQEPQGPTTPKAQTKRAGILKKPKTSPVAGSDSPVFVPSSPSDQLSKDRLGALSLSSPQEGDTSVTIVKASPGSRREFSVSVAKSLTSAPRKDQKEPTAEEEEGGRIPAEGEASGSHDGQTESPEARPQPGQEKDDMVEMEDIKDCKVTQVAGAEVEEEEEEEEGRVIKTQPEQD